jgi:hypothetical protein
MYLPLPALNVIYFLHPVKSVTDSRGHASRDLVEQILRRCNGLQDVLGSTVSIDFVDSAVALCSRKKGLGVFKRRTLRLLKVFALLLSHPRGP